MHPETATISESVPVTPEAVASVPTPPTVGGTAPAAQEAATGGHVPAPSPTVSPTISIVVEGPASVRERHGLQGGVSSLEEAHRLVESINASGRGDARLVERNGQQVLVVRELLVD